MSPTISTKKKTKRTLTSRRAMERRKLVYIGVIAGCAATILVHLALQSIHAVSESRQRSLELNSLVAQHTLARLESDELFEDDLNIAKRAQAENLAEASRKKEWERRRQMAADLAKTETEMNMLEMKRIGLDRDISDKDALKRIAKMASPPRSGVGITREKYGWKVEVAFPYEEVIEAHPELRGSIKGYYYQVRMTSAAIMHDIFAFGGPRDVHRVLTSCQGMVTVSSARTGKSEQLREMFVVTARDQGRDWSHMSLHDVEDKWRVLTNYFPKLLDSL